MKTIEDLAKKAIENGETIETILKKSEKWNDLSYKAQEKLAFTIAGITLIKYGKRTKEAKNLISKIWDTFLAGGCPGAVFDAAEALHALYV